MKSEQTIKNKHINKNRLRSTRRKMDCRVGKIGSQQYRNDGKQTCGYYAVQFSLVQLLNCARLFVTPWIAAYQASLSITSSQNLLKFMPIELVMPSNHLILCHLFSSFNLSQHQGLQCCNEHWDICVVFSFSSLRVYA